MNDFLDIINAMDIDKNIRSHVLLVAKDLAAHIGEGEEPSEWLDMLLVFYQAVPSVQEKIRNVIIEALVRYK